MSAVELQPSAYELVTGANVWQEDHFRLHSGLHTDIKIDMEKLPDEHGNFMRVMRMVANKLFETDADGVIGMPNGARRLLRSSFPLKLPQPLLSHKTEEGGFSIDAPWVQQFIKKAGRIAIFDDVLTTGGSPLAMADKVREINPDIRLDLVAIWRRGILLPEVSDIFDSQSYLIEKEIPAWPAEDCKACPLAA